jgi:hypothetical protein
MIADKVGDDILDDLDEFFECVRLDIEAGNVRGYGVVTARGFVIADSYDVAHDPHLGARDFGQRPASQTDALPIYKMGLSGPERKFYGFLSSFFVSVRRMAAARWDCAAITRISKMGVTPVFGRPLLLAYRLLASPK